MTKKGAILTAILAILLITIVIIVASQNNKPNNLAGDNGVTDNITENNVSSDKFALQITYETGLNLRRT